MLMLFFCCEDRNYARKAQVVCEDFCKKIIDVLFFEFEIRISDFEFCGGDFSGDNTVGVVVPTINISIDRDMCRAVYVGDSCLFGGADRPLFAAYSAMYRAALDSSDEITKFMLLYNILCSLVKGESQGGVDRLIASVCPGVEVLISPQGCNKRETVFTRLRNEISHHRSGSIFRTERYDVYKVVSVFNKIVKRVIQEYCNA